MTSSPLERIIERETFREIILLLEPLDLIVATLRLEGLTDEDIARLMGRSRPSVTSRMKRARERIIHLRPDLASALEGRSHPRHRADTAQGRPLEEGWLCDWREEE